ncbi:hypothetical protein CWATWH0401_3341 [Crocosphaera watsonii WH 0401]|uniref:Uncharacterized protein n=1 Tax=Crocosphaera watsonii WH 0401 TaxID=555881 RepID=T2JF73_CROWT|nr:hypothetical protein CWATWH0401_3341 [Crocosphaera watsonii WH 0401]
MFSRIPGKIGTKLNKKPPSFMGQMGRLGERKQIFTPPLPPFD